MKRFIQIISSTLLFAGVAFVVLPSSQVSAINVFDTACDDNKSSQVCQSTKDDAESVAKTVTNVILWALGIVSVIMVVIGGFMYVISSGDAGRTKNAKNTILYAVVGLVVALGAYAIVNLVTTNF